MDPPPPTKDQSLKATSAPQTQPQPQAKTAPAQPQAKTASAQPQAKTASAQPQAKMAPAQPQAKTAPAQPQAKTAPAQPQAKTAPTAEGPNPNKSVKETEAQIRLALPKRSPKKSKTVIQERKFPNIRQQIIEIERYKREFLTKNVALGDKQVLPSTMTIRNKQKVAPVLTAEQRTQKQKQQETRRREAEKQQREQDAEQKRVSEANFKEWSKRKQKQKKVARKAQAVAQATATNDEKEKHQKMVEGLRVSQKSWAKERLELEARLVKAEEKYALNNVRTIKKKHGRESPTQPERVYTRPIPPTQGQKGQTRRRRGRQHANQTAPAGSGMESTASTASTVEGVPSDAATAPIGGSTAGATAGGKGNAAARKGGAGGPKKKKWGEQGQQQGRRKSAEGRALKLKGVYRQAYAL
jgi:hypothetical protein